MKDEGPVIEVLSSRDDEMFNDTIKIKEDKITSSLYTAFKEYVFEWPYFCFISQ